MSDITILPAMSDDPLAHYWFAAWKEGKEARDHDTEDGAAQRALMASDAFLKARDAQWQAAVDAAVMQERAECDTLTDDMLRYAMGAMGTGSPKDADRFRTFWRLAIRARTKEKT